MTDSAKPAIIIPQITIGIMKIDNISSANLSELIEHSKHYKEIAIGTSVNTRAVANTHDKPEDITEDVPDCDITNDKPVGDLIEPSDDNITIITRNMRLTPFTHPKNLMIMETTFDRFSSITDKLLLTEIYDNAKFCVHTNYSTRTCKVAIILPPNLCKTLLKASFKQFKKCMATYYLFMFDAVEFNKEYNYPYKEIYNYDNNIGLDTSIFLMYDRTDYQKFNTTQTYEEYVEECFKCGPGQLFSKKNIYRKLNGSRDGYYDTVASGMVKQFDSDPTSVYNTLDVLHKIAKKELVVVKGDDWYNVEFDTLVLSSAVVNIFYRKRF